MQGVRRGFRLGAEFRKVGKEKVSTRRDSLELPHTTSSGEREEEESLTSQIPKGAGIQRLKWRAPEERKNAEKIPGRKARRRKRAFDTERAEKVMKNQMRRQLRKEKTKSGREHTTIRHYSGIRKMKGTPEIKKEVCGLWDSRTRHGMAMRVAPRTIGGPLGLIVQPRGRAPGEGKLASHSRREAEVARGSLAMRNPVSPSARRFP